MKRNRPILVIIALCLVGWTANVASATEGQRSVLLIFDGRTDLPSNIVVERAFRTVLAEQFAFDLDVRSEYVDNPSAEDFPALLSWLRRKHYGKAFDVVIPIGPGSLQFARDVRLELFPDSQIVYWGRRTALTLWPSDVPLTGVVAPERAPQIRGNAEFIRALQPDLKRLVVVTGASPEDKTWESVARRELQRFEGQFAVDYLVGLSLEDLQERLARLPDKAAVLLLPINEDGTGRRLLRSQFLRKLVEEATAPVYSTSAVYLDNGLLGGALLDQESMAIEAAELAVRLLRGEDIGNMPVRETRLVPMANSTALDRWGIPENRLPPGTLVRYREPSLWSAYKWHILGAISLCFLQTGLIVALLIHRAHRRRAEKARIESQLLLQSAIDALNARVALLDQNGTIIVVNQTWRSFAEANPLQTKADVGDNYLEAGAFGTSSEESRLVSNGIRRLLSGAQEDFRFVYPSPRSEGNSWFQVRVNRFEMYGMPWLVVTHEEVTEIKQAHDAQQHLTGLLMRAQDEERRRIARDLHDVTVQNMAAIKADLSGIERLSGNLDFDTEEMLQEGISLCDQVVRELRTLSYLLHPPFLDEAGLVPALRWFVRGFMQRSGVQVELLVMTNIGRLPPEIETALFRVVQESLTNIHRHSGSRNAVIWINKERDNVILRIRDEGHGFQAHTMQDHQESAPSMGVGIAGMRQRLRQFGGRLEIDSSSVGTHVTAVIPISKDQNVAYLSGR